MEQFKEGETVIHKLTKEIMLIIKVNTGYDLKYKARRFNKKTDLYEDIYLYEVEIERWEEN